MDDTHDPEYREVLNKMFKLGLALKDAGFQVKLHYGEFVSPYCSAGKWGRGLTQRSDIEKLFGLASLHDMDVRLEGDRTPVGITALFHRKEKGGRWDNG